MMAWARKKRPRQEPGELAQEQIPTPARTKVNDLGSKLLVGGVYGAIAMGLLSGCGALGMSVMSSGAEKAPVVETMNTATAEGTAVSYVTAWLTASRQDQSLLSAYVKEDSRKVPETPLAVRDVAVAGVEKTEDPDVISVLVAAHVEQRTELEQDGQTPKNTTSSAPASASTEAKTSAKPAPTTYALRYYQVAVKQTEGTVQVIGYPTPARLGHVRARRSRWDTRTGSPRPPIWGPRWRASYSPTAPARGTSPGTWLPPTRSRRSPRPPTPNW